MSYLKGLLPTFILETLVLIRLSSDVVNTPLSRKRTRSDSSPIFGDFSPIGIDDLEALCEIEAQLNQASSPLSKKRKRSPAPLPKVDSRPLELLKENKVIIVPPSYSKRLTTGVLVETHFQLVSASSATKVVSYVSMTLSSLL
jgi:hypothetical protein